MGDVEKTMREPASLWELLRTRSSDDSGRWAYSFLAEGETESARLTYGELDRQARTIAARLLQAVVPGDRALLLYPPGLDFVAAFFGCLYAGVVAVPAYPPRSRRRSGRLAAIVEDAGPGIVLTTAALAARWTAVEARPAELQSLRFIATDELPGDLAAGWREPRTDRSSLAFLQYTSGSTSTPKGVMVSQGNLLANEERIRRAFGQSQESVIVGWLPLYHDMGLIGNLLQPLYVGAPCVLMPPLAFLQSPARWLRAVSRYRATTSGGPSFAYELCAQRVSAEARRDLDLSSWRVAFNGSEPVRVDTLDRFADAFAPCGFRREAFYPCYGLAEATLFVSGGEHQAAPVIRERDGRSLVGCGRSSDGERIVVVSPATLAPCGEGEVGEIWVAGPSVAQGYWGRPEATEETFGARLADGEGPFLRTGDLGFLAAGELFVTGRIKDLVIVRGRNHYPQDLELTAERSLPGLRPGGGAAFTAELAGEERLVLVQEVERGARVDPLTALQALREAIAEEHDVYLHQVVLIRAGSLPKTSSGKVQRHACRQAFLEGALETVAGGAPVVLPGKGSAAERRDPLADLLRERIARALRVEPSQVSLERSLPALGFDSLMAANLKAELEAETGVPLPLALLLEARGLTEVVERLRGEGAVPEGRVSLAPEAAPDGAALPASHGQKALWFLQRLAPESAAYNLAAAAVLDAELEPELLGEALRILADRHAALRTRFPSERGEPVQQIQAALEPSFSGEDARSWSDGELSARLEEKALRPFVLDAGPLLRVGLYRRPAGRSVLLLVIHHIVADFWSLSNLLTELGLLLRELEGGEPARLAPLPLTYGDWVRWQQRMLAERGEELWETWRRRLAGLSALALPFDEPAPAVQTFRGAGCRLRIGWRTTAALRSLGHARGATLYMTLLAAFQTALLRWTGQEDVPVGSPSSGREDRRLFPLVGYFVNLLVLRTDLGGDPHFPRLLDRVRRVALDAFAGQEYPFALLAERLQPVRDAGRSPLVQASFNFLRGTPEGLEAFAVGATGARARAGSRLLEVAPLEPRTAQFELALVAAEMEDGLALLFQYGTDRFDGATAARLLGHLGSLLDGIAAGAERPLSELPLLTAAERHHLVAVLNRTAVEVPGGPCAHDPFLSWAGRTPDVTALVHGREMLTYGELAGRVNRLAWELVRQGAAPGELVGIFMDRSLDLVVGLLGILAAGCAYVPLDPTYPEARIAHSLEDAGIRRIITRPALAARLPVGGWRPVFPSGPDEGGSPREVPVRVTPDHPAYVIYTSGSTGRPKGVMVPHAAVVNFFGGMDAVVGCGPGDTLLAVTSIAFDISVLELLWTLGRGARVILHGEGHPAPAARRPGAARRPLECSLFYFASNQGNGERQKYRLLLEGARFADREGLSAVWTPERHFHAFGGLFPNPSVLGGALAAITERVQIRAGSVVLPLHHPIRVAEEWSVVDNLSGGRVGLAFASGWHADDFVFSPESYASRKEVLYRDLETVRRLWRGETTRVRGGSGQEIEVGIFPRPLQPELPVWITSAGQPETFTQAGEVGARVLTHLLGQSPDEVAAKVRLYRQGRERQGLRPEDGGVTLMLHTFVGESREAVRDTVRGPFIEYLRSSVGLIRNLIASLGLPLRLEEMSPRDLEDLLAFAFDRYFETSGLFGTPEECLERLEELRSLGVDEVACLVDFGVPEDEVLASLPRLAEVARRANAPRPAWDGVEEAPASLAGLMALHRPTLLQCTPSRLRMIALECGSLEPLRPLRALLLGGEALPPALARQVKEALPARLINVYGPTETTVWSTALEVTAPVGSSVPIGRPIANTEIHVLDRHQGLVPLGAVGEVCIGGLGVANGYWRRPDLTAERFIPDPFGSRPGGRLYRTGDLGVWRPDGLLELRGRADRQVKVRGFRVELEEVEAHLCEHPAVREAAVVLSGPAEEERLAAYVALRVGDGASVEELRVFLQGRVTEAMVPSFFVALEVLPRTPNGKLDRRALPAPGTARELERSAFVPPRSPFERQIAEIWREVLGVDRVGVDDNFFDLGGHSLLMAQVHGRLREVVPGELPLVKLLEHPTIGSLARYLRQEEPDGAALDGSRERARRQQEGRRRLQQRAMEKVQTS
jgi:natural product biosynthesis luciferase-like monooxygenase protein